MNLAEKNRLSKQKIAEEKLKRKKRLATGAVIAIQALLLVASAVPILAICLSQMSGDTLTAFAQWSDYIKWVSIADAIGLVGYAVVYTTGLEEKMDNALCKCTRVLCKIQFVAMGPMVIFLIACLYNG